MTLSARAQDIGDIEKRIKEVLAGKMALVYRPNDIRVAWFFAAEITVLAAAGLSQPVISSPIYLFLLLVAAAACANSFSRAGIRSTRQINGIVQAILSVLFIHATSANSQSHFIVFISLTLLGFYMDWHVPVLFAGTSGICLVAASITAPTAFFGADQKVYWELLSIALVTGMIALFNYRGYTELKIATRRQTGSEYANLEKIAEKSKIESELLNQQKKIASITAELKEGAAQVRHIMNELRASSQQGLSAVVQMSGVCEELRQTAELCMAKARQVSNNSLSVLKISQSGEEATVEVVESMKRIRAQIDALGECMTRLGERTTSIGEILKSVDDISQQSNLLSVNASIEAAKAGEHGRGFGVVAREVKELVVQSKNATHQVRGILSEITDATNAATLTTELGHKAVSSGEEVVTQAQSSIMVLAASLSEASQAGKQIELSNQQQLEGVNQFVGAVDDLGKIEHMVVGNVKELESCVNSFNRLADELTSLLNPVQIEEMSERAENVEVALAN
jgi:methyl-accepting chemotaxis protein